MTDQTSKDIASFPPASLNSALMRARQNQAAHGVDKVVSLGLAASEPSQIVTEPRGAVVRDWASALDLVQEASEAIRVSEERASQLEEQLSEVVSEAGEEIKRLTQQLTATEQKLSQAELRATVSEARATNAEDWLIKLHDAVLSAFTPVLRAGSTDKAELMETKVASALPA